MNRFYMGMALVALSACTPDEDQGSERRLRGSCHGETSLKALPYRRNFAFLMRAIDAPPA